MIQKYDRNEYGDELYPKRRDGSEYYRYGFAVDRKGTPRYARDAAGNEIYPKSPPFFLKHPMFDYPVYAQDALGNEIYPKFKRREIFAVLNDGEILAARYSSGRQRYPLDRHGNEYLPVCKITGKPYYLRDEEGNSYRPITVNGYAMYIDSEENEEEDHLYEKTDALNSKIYTADHKMKRKSVWMHVMESCIGLTGSLCIIFPILHCIML